MIQEPLRVASLCSGYEATSLGLALAGWDHRLVFVADPDPAAAKVLAHHHPDVPNLGDITRIAWEELGLTGQIDLLTAGFPCTDISGAGKRAGLAEDIVIPAGVMPCGCPWADHQPDCPQVAHRWGPSHVPHREEIAETIEDLNDGDRAFGDGPPPERVVKGTRSGVWAHVRRCVDELRPRLVLIENVAALLSTPANRSTDGTDGEMEPGPADLGDGPGRSLLRAAGAVLGDLADIGYDAVWQVVSAAEVGAPHLRKRIFILAWPAADPPRDAWRFGYGNGLAVPGTDSLSLLPTPKSSDADRGDCPSERVRRSPSLVSVDALLPTPRARDVKGAETEATRASRVERGTAHAGHDLPTALTLLPTPRATDGSKGDPNQRGSSGDLMLPSAVMQLLSTPTAASTPKSKRALSASTDNGRRSGGGQSSPPGLDEVALLVSGVRPDNLPPDEELPPKTRALVESLLPTPTVADARGSRNATAGRGADASSEWSPGWSLSDIAYADRWGEYGRAIARWERVVGRPAPDPTEPGTKGQPRLSPAFVEWMQGLPAGYVTAVPGVSRNDALRLLGNANPPQQYAAAITRLAAVVAAVTAREEAA